VNNKFKIDDPVLVWMPDGEVRKGNIVSITPIPYSMGYMRGAQYNVRLTNGIMVYYVDEDMVYKDPEAHIKCDCGSYTVGHPGHSYFCSVEIYRQKGPK
jgi:hypothetical protein